MTPEQFAELLHQLRMIRGGELGISLILLSILATLLFRKDKP